MTSDLVRMLLGCLATPKVSPKASGHILGPFEKTFFSSNFRPQEAIFSYIAAQASKKGILWVCSKPKGSLQMKDMI